MGPPFFFSQNCIQAQIPRLLLFGLRSRGDPFFRQAFGSGLSWLSMISGKRNRLPACAAFARTGPEGPALRLLQRRRAAAAAPTENQRHQEQDHENEEQNLGDAHGASRDPAKPKQRRDQRNDKEHRCVIKHVVSPDLWR